MVSAGIEIPSAGGGLHDALRVQPRQLHLGDEVYVVLHLRTKKVRFDPVKLGTTTTRLVCRNSYDPGCGAFRWDPDPGPNQPLGVAASAQQVKAGDPVNFHIVADDPDAKIDRCYAFDFGDGQKGSTCPPPAVCPTPYGPWTPPAKVHDHWEVNVPHKYSAPGPYLASFTLQSHSFCSPDPYGGSGQAPATAKVS